MEFMKIRFCLLSSVLALSTACGTHQVKGEPPYVGISRLSLKADMLTARFDLRNINDVELEIDAIDIKILAQNIELAHYASNLSLSVDPNTTEEVSLDKQPGSSARQLLGDLESGQVSSLPFFLEGRIHTQRDGYLEFKHEGHLYPIPGRPGQFRSASSRTREQR
jgi:LEA14-like dessication related protein